MHATRGSATGGVVIREMASGSGQTCSRFLAALPHWFGIPDAVTDYVEKCEHGATTIASIQEQDVGLLNLRIHTAYAAEVWLMAVLPQHHRQGIGRALLEHAERTLIDGGIEYLQVKTLSAAKPDDGYERTRAFYLACGFRPLEEFPTLWGEQNPAVMMVKALAH